MGIQLIDGKGTGGAAEVRNQKLVTITDGLSPLALAALDGRAYSFKNVTYDPDAADTIILLKNIHPTKNFHICDLALSSDVVTQWHAHIITAVFTQAGTLAITPVNLNSNFGNNSSIDAFGDETANTQGALVHPHFVTTIANTSIQYNYNGALVIAPGHAFAIDCVLAATAAHVSVIGYQEE